MEKTIFNESIKYSGKVKISEYNGTVKISEKEIKNSGFLPLFKFLTYCLQGNYKVADNIRPIKIKTFYNSSKASEIDPNNKVGSSTAFIYADSMPLINNDDETSSSLTLHFSIPCAYLVGTQINQLRLYAANTKDDDPSAEVFLLNKEGEWDPITIDGQKNTYNLSIDWTLKISN